MIYIIYILAALGVIFLIFIFWLGKTATKVKKELRNEPREFQGTTELINFVRSIYECKIKHRVVMYGFVDSVTYDDSLQRSGLSDGPCLSVDVVLITNKGMEKVNTTCGHINTSLQRGDFVGVLPFHNERHNLWYYVTVGKLKPLYLGANGFYVQEDYVD